ncbi:phosphoribosylamine--glycine ligase [bacterium]|nr:phosphoribosylamine--glycine ligase [bacterium]
MNVLIIGGGGREHAIAWKVRQSVKVGSLFCTPGNAGIMRLCEPVPVKADDFKGLVQFAKRNDVGLTIIGPEAPLCAGIVNEFRNAGMQALGPDSRGAQLEGSKVFAKQFMKRHGIPTAPFETFTDPATALEYVKKKGAPLVVKADGLAAGKGVTVCRTVAEAEQALRDAMEKKVFGDAGREVVIEEMLEGEEASVLALTDGKVIVPLEPAQDHKAVFDQDQGPNTGGMGAYSPAPVVTDTVMREVEAKVLKPTLEGLKKEGMDYRGVIYAGLMIKEGRISVLEYNVRFGDPETQAVLPRLKSDLVDVCLAVTNGRLEKSMLSWDKRAAVCVVMASGGYPGPYHTHLPINGVEKAEAMRSILVFHAGTEMSHGQLVTSGGRVLGVTALGKDIATAIENAYKAVEAVHFPGAHFRWDIGAKAVE